ncbi:hypothetical protein FKM82_024145 [Ascaphus truei]
MSFLRQKQKTFKEDVPFLFHAVLMHSFLKNYFNILKFKPFLPRLIINFHVSQICNSCASQTCNSCASQTCNSFSVK